MDAPTILCDRCNDWKWISTAIPCPDCTEGEEQGGEMDVGCERDDGLLNTHPESETCEVCAPAVTPSGTETGDSEILSPEKFADALEVVSMAIKPGEGYDASCALLAHDAALRVEVERLRDRLRDAEPGVLQDDVRDLLLAAGLEHYARPVSPHRVVRDEILPAVERLRAERERRRA